MRKSFQRVIDFGKKYSFPITLLFVFLNTLLASWNIIQGDINFNTDIARDFLLFDELSQKGIILIGPRASGLTGLFHGPLWIYLNYPAYLLGQGNPLVLGYFWVLLNISFLLISYIVASKIFNRAVANVYIILLSGTMVFFLDNLFNPYGAMYVMPIFLFCIVRYSQKLNWKYLAGCFLALGAMIQFQMAIGLPFMLLTLGYVFYVIYKNKKYSHLFTLLLLILPFVTYLLFEIRHSFQQTHAILDSFSGKSDVPSIPYVERVANRFDNFIRTLYFSQTGTLSNALNTLISVITILFLYNIFSARNKKDRFRQTYFLIIYFYAGFYILSTFFNGNLLYHYTFPLIPLTFLLFSSLIMYEKKKLFLGLLAVIILANYVTGIGYIQQRIIDRGVALKSWQFHKNVAEKIFQSNDNNIGYFIYAPDFYAYAPKYAFLYVKSLHPEKNVALFEKKAITYTVVEPAPADRPEVNSEYWETAQVKLSSSPVQEIPFANGYKIKKYKLSDKEISEPIDPQVSDWLHYR